MSLFVVAILFLILFLLSALHFYWVMGGRWGFANALPTNVKGDRVLNPKKVDSALVSLVLLSFAGYYLNNILGYAQLPTWIDALTEWIVPIIFLIRAVGDFNYVGFFKKVKRTPFGRLDSRYFSPLCLLLSLMGFFLLLIH